MSTRSNRSGIPPIVPPAPDKRTAERSALKAEQLFPSTNVNVDTRPPFPLRPDYTGRSSVLGRMGDAFSKAVDGNGLSFVGLIGDAGMGKSRTVKEFARTVGESDPHVRFLVGNCMASDKTYAAFADLLGRRFGILPADSDVEAQDKLIAGIAEVVSASRVTEIAHLLAHLMGRPFKDSQVVAPLAGSHQQLEVRTFLALKRFAAADAEAGPLVFCIENLDQADAASINLLHFLVSGLESSRIMVVGTATNELFDRFPNFGDSDVDFERIDLEALSDDEAEGLFKQLVKIVPSVPLSLVKHSRTLGGSPRAIFEFVRYLLETKVIVRSRSGWTCDTAVLAKLSLPKTHLDVVEGRMNAMPEEERMVLQRAAVVGETFWLDAVVALIRAKHVKTNDPDGPTLSEIAAAGDTSKSTVTRAFTQLVAQDWLVEVKQSSKAGEREYRFAYGFLWSMVYDATSQEVRDKGHHRTAQWLELRPNGRDPAAQEDIARHLELAGDVRGAARRYRRAADHARKNFFNDKAIRLYSHALQCLGEADQAARIHLWHDMGSVYELKGDYEAATGAFERMLRLSWICASRTKAAVAFNKMGRVWRKKGDLKLSLDYLSRGLQLFEQAGDERGIAGSLDDIGQVEYLLGNFERAHAKVTAGLQRRGTTGDKRSIAHSLSTLGNIQQDRGRIQEALNCHREALDLRRLTGDRAGVASSLNNLAVIAYGRNKLGEAKEGWEQALKEAEDIGALPLQAAVLANLGEIAIVENRHDEARRRLSESINIAREIADRRLEVEGTRNMARLEHILGNSSKAREHGHRAYTTASEAGLRDYEGRALLTLAEVHGGSLFDAAKTDEDLSIDNNEPAAETYYKQGIDIMRSLGNDSELAKGLENYGRYKVEQGESKAGRILLQESFDIFTRLGVERNDLNQLIRSL